MAETTCPVFTPSLEEFQDFYGYIQLIEKKVDLNQIGICKIIPPKNWYVKEYDMPVISQMVVKSPIRQLLSSVKAGVYSANLFEMKNMTVKNFMEYSRRNFCDGSSFYRERMFWRNITSSSLWDDPIYGADMLGTLFGKEHASSWNLNEIDNLLRLSDINIPGVTSSMLYIGVWRSMFAFHVEDLNLYSINYLHHGESKSWYSIPYQYKSRFESMSDSFHCSDSIECSEYLRHKTKIFSPSKLKEFGIPIQTAYQEVGEFIITFPGSYHAGFNHGFNIAEATNFATPNWIDIGKKARVCKCTPHAVNMDVDLIETLYYRDVVKNGSSRYGLTTMDKSQSILKLENAIVKERIVCFCKKKWSFNHKSTENQLQSYLCKKCLAKCHKICLEEEVIDISSKWEECLMCYDIDNPEISSSSSSSSSETVAKVIESKSKNKISNNYYSNSNSNAQKSMIGHGNINNMNKPMTNSSYSISSSVKEERNGKILLLTKLSDDISITTAESTPKPMIFESKYPNFTPYTKVMTMKYTSIKRPSVQIVRCHVPDVVKVSRRSQTILSGDLKRDYLSLIATETKVEADIESQREHKEYFIQSKEISSPQTSLLVTESITPLKKKKTGLQVKSQVLATLPGLPTPVYGTVVDIIDNLGRFHEKGSRKGDDMWIPLKNMTEMIDGDDGNDGNDGGDGDGDADKSNHHNNHPPNVRLTEEMSDSECVNHAFSTPICVDCGEITCSDNSNNNTSTKNDLDSAQEIPIETNTLYQKNEMKPDKEQVDDMIKMTMDYIVNSVTLIRRL